MLEWLKTILGDAYTPEIDTAVSQEIGKGFVARTDFNAKAAKVTELETEAKQLRETAKTHATQLEELKKATGDSAELTRKIEDLERQNKEDKAKFEKELGHVKLLAAVDAELTAAGSKNNTALKAVLADFLTGAKVEDGKIVAKVGDESVTLAAKIEAMKKDASTDFMFGTVAKYEGWKPGEGGDGKKPEDGKKPSEMSYSELTEYLANNPDAKLED